MKKRILSIVLSLAMCLSLMPAMSLTAAAANEQPTYSGGTGTQDDPYLRPGVKFCVSVFRQSQEYARERADFVKDPHGDQGPRQPESVCAPLA